jgi:small subunit ribosomal protein S16
MALRPQRRHTVAVKLRLKRMGRTHRSFFRLSAVDSRRPRDGKVLEELGWYDPIVTDAQHQTGLKLDRIEHWLKVGAQPSATVADLLKRQGVDVAKARIVAAK